MIEGIEQANRLWRENEKNLLRYGLSLVRQSVLHRVGVPVQARGDELAFVTRFSPQLTPKRAEDLEAELEKAIYHIERHANPRILFLDVSLPIMMISIGRASGRERGCQ